MPPSSGSPSRDRGCPHRTNGRHASENKLVAYCEQHGERAAGRERFTGIAFADVYAHAQTLDYTAMTSAERAKAKRLLRLEDIDFDRLEALQADDKLWTVTQVADALGLSLCRTRQLPRQTTDWLQYGQGQWPPRPHTYSSHPQPVEVTWLPPHQAMLPLPDDTSTENPRWRAGTIRTWAMQTGRMSPDGVPNRARPPGRPRRGHVTDRERTPPPNL